MLAHRMLGKTKFVGDLPVAEAFDREFHDLILALREGPSTGDTGDFETEVFATPSPPIVMSGKLNNLDLD
jgi:hypothetical protein